MKIEAILFDFWNTLCLPKVNSEKYWKTRTKYVKEVLEEHGYKIKESELLEVIKETRRICNKVRRYSLVEVNVKSEVAVMLHLLKIQENPKLLEKLVHAYAKPFIEYVEPDPEAKPLLQELKTRGIKTGIVSNTMFSWANKKILEKHNLIQYFDTLVFSDEVGRIKPHPQIFQQALESLKVAPSKTIMVGDEEADIRGALNTGIKPVLIVRNKELQELENGVVIRSLREIFKLLT